MNQPNINDYDSQFHYNPQSDYLNENQRELRIQNEESLEQTAKFSTLDFIGALFSKTKKFWQGIRDKKTSEVTEREKFIAYGRRQIIELREKNQQEAQRIKQIQQFIEANEELLAKFKECVLKTKEILLPPPHKVNSEIPITQHPILEEWRKEMHENHHYEMLRRRFLDFLQKNPEFCELFDKYYNKKTDQKYEQEDGIKVKSCSPLPLMPPAKASEEQIAFPARQTPLENLLTDLVAPISLKSNHIGLSSQDSQQRVFKLTSLLINQTNQETVKILRRMKRFIKTNGDLFSLFQRWIINLSTIPLNISLKKYSYHSLKLGNYQNEKEKTYQLDLMKTFFLMFLNEHSEVKEKFLRKLQKDRIRVILPANIID